MQGNSVRVRGGRWGETGGAGHTSKSLGHAERRARRRALRGAATLSATFCPPRAAAPAPGNLGRTHTPPARLASGGAGAPGGEVRAPFDLLLGADGARSAVRAALARALPGMEVAALTSPVAQMEFKAFHALEDCAEIRGLLPAAARWVRWGCRRPPRGGRGCWGGAGACRPLRSGHRVPVHPPKQPSSS